MEWSKLKNIIIFLLLLVNAFFLTLVIYQEQRSNQYEVSAEESAIYVLKQNGIFVNFDTVPWENTLQPQKLERNREQETELAVAMLGTVQQTDVGAVAEYVGEKGRAQFYQTGEFCVHFDPGTEPAQNPELHATSYFQKIGLQAVVTQTLKNGTGMKVILWQEIEGAPVFNCVGKAEYKEDMLRVVNGWQILGKPLQTKEVPLTSTTLLIRFLNGVNALQKDCTEIRKITTGYVYDAGLSRLGMLIPTWYIETDVGDYLMDCMDGTLECVGQT